MPSSTVSSASEHGDFISFGSEYILELEHCVVVETPQLGHATSNMLSRLRRARNNYLPFW